MNSEPKNPHHKTEAERRAERRANELRANLQRRKQQDRARRAGDAATEEGLPAARSSDGGDQA